MEKNSRVLSLALFLAILLFAYSFSYAQWWQYEDIISNPSDNGGEDTDMQADLQGNLHLIYYDRGNEQITYAFKSKSSSLWNVENLLFTGKHPHLFVDDSFNVHVSYYVKRINGDSTDNSGDLMYVVKKSGLWSSPIYVVRDSTGPDDFLMGHDNNIAVDSIGKIYIAYNDGRYWVFYPDDYEWNAKLAVRDTNGVWNFYKIDGDGREGGANYSDGVGEYLKLSFNSTGTLHIAETERWDGQIRYGKIISDSIWSVDSVISICHVCGPSYCHPNPAWVYTSNPIQLDMTMLSNNRAIFAWVQTFDCLLSVSNRFLYVLQADSVHDPLAYNTKMILDSTGTWPTIATKGSDTIYIAYYRTNDNTMRLATSYDGGINYINSEIIEPNIQRPGRNPTMVLWNDTLHLVYYDPLKRSPRYAWKNIDSTSWHLDYVTKNLDAGEYLDYAVVDSDSVHLAYYDNNYKRLFYGVKSDSVWSFETVDSIGDVGMYCKIQLRSDGIPQIIYYDRTNGNLKLATKNSGVWDIQRIDSTDNVGSYCSFRVDSTKNDTFHIAYHDETNFRLRYAKGKGVSWTIENADSTPGKRVGQYASLELDSAGRPHIAYMEVDSATSYGKLRYIYKTDTGWTAPQVVDANPGGAKWNSLKFNRFGKPVIAHTYDFGGAKEVHCTYLGGNGYWGTEKISKPYLIGYTSLDIADSGQYFITYAEQFNSSVPPTVQMIQRDMNATTPSWSNFPITNNIGAIGLSSKLFISDNISNDTAIAYIIGKKSATLNKGIAKLMFTPFVVMNDTSEDNPIGITEEKYLSAILLDNYPNPFSSSTSIRFYLPHSAQITLRVYNLMGQMVDEIAHDKKYSEGIHEETFTARALPSGIYFYEIITPQKRYVQKMLLMK